MGTRPIIATAIRYDHRAEDGKRFHLFVVISLLPSYECTSQPPSKTGTSSAQACSIGCTKRNVGSHNPFPC